MPQVSICVPVYNMDDYIGLAIQSALEQVYEDFEIIVCDNASTDNTVEVLSGFSDPRLKIIRNEINVGMIKNFNLTVELSNGKYIKFLEADDLLLPDCLTYGVEKLSDYDNVGIVSYPRIIIDQHGAEMRRVRHTPGLVSGHEILNRVHRHSNEIGTPTDVMIRKDLFMKEGMFDLAYKSYLNDYAFWLKCCGETDVYFAEDYFVKVREHTDRTGSRGVRTNIDIDVNFLMIREVFSGALPIDHSLAKKTIMILRLYESYFWRGLTQIIQSMRNDEIKIFLAWRKLFSNLTFWYIAIGALYTCIRSPYYFLKNIFFKIVMKVWYKCK